MARILVGMSGGVDSSVAALLLREQGHEVEGAYIRNWMAETDPFGECPWKKEMEDAQAVADQLKIPFRMINLIEDYRKHVVDYLLRGYAEGVTPNPDMYCNREIKFGVFLNRALEEGFDGIGTGHYVRTDRTSAGGHAILEGLDPNKDQSYFLALLKQKQITHSWFPLGGLLKSEVRAKATAAGLVTASKKDSQGICFIGKVRMQDFLKAYLPENPGAIVDTEGNMVGEHKGLHNYTLGQRQGIRVASVKANIAYVVVEKRMATNTLVIGYDSPDTQGLYSQGATLTHLSSTGQKFLDEMEIEARPRYRAPRTRIRFQRQDHNSTKIVFTNAQRALAPGQICALYDGKRLLGGGVFAKIHYSDTDREM